MPKESNKIIYKTKIGQLKHLVGMHYIEVPPPVIKKLGGSMKCRVLCTVNNELTFQGGLMALGEGSAYISINASRLKKLGIRSGSAVEISLKKDESKFGMEMAEELKELLRQDREGKRRFEMLTPGKQRYIIHYVNSVKNSQKRVDRALLLITNLKKTTPGKETFRQMLGMDDQVTG
ncbi:MAG: YdeI/OmpD-associated family protein [Bacteroidia bacterium]